MEKRVINSYRPDIDGLRAIAILSVLFFHAFPNYLQGGFVGVDIFFVISGFLITSIILRDISNSSFSFRQFYSKRIRRIFPTLITVLFSCMVFGWYVLTSAEYKQLGSHILAGSLFGSNIQLWSEVNYFDNSSNTKPLLHLWSLSIEEQFYIIFPLILLFLWRRKFNILTVTFIFFIISLYFNIKNINKYTEFVFYFPHTRFWEILCGSLIAKILIDIQEKKYKYLVKYYDSIEYSLNRLFFSDLEDKNLNVLFNLFSFFGISLVLYSIFYFNSKMKFPGIYALIPVIGTTLLIIGGPKSLINKFLSNKAFVHFGLISYSLYLWHWPILTFIRIIENGSPSTNYLFFGLFLSYILAEITTKFIENPIRKSQKKPTLYLLIIFMIGLSFIGYYTYIKDGFKDREAASLGKFSEELGHKEFFEYIYNNFYPCTPEKVYNNTEKWESFTRCAQSKKSESPDIVIFGDSHAENLFVGIAEALPERNVTYYYLRGFLTYLNVLDSNESFREILNNKQIKIVVINAFYYFELPDQKNLLVNRIKEIQKSGKKVVLIDDIPLFPFDASQCVHKRWLSTKSPTCEFSRKDFQKYYSSYSAILDEIVKNNNEVKLIKVADTFCNSKVCSMNTENKLLYRDDNHLSVYGSKIIGKRIAEILKSY